MFIEYTLVVVNVECLSLISDHTGSYDLEANYFPIFVYRNANSRI